MQIELGNILKHVAPFCSIKDPKAWNGLIKIHLKNLDRDAKSLLKGTRIFALTLDHRLTVAKVAKGYMTALYSKKSYPSSSRVNP